MSRRFNPVERRRGLLCERPVKPGLAFSPHRPHNSLYVVSDYGELVTRYDERLLSNTKISFMYSPGKTAVTFEVDGFRFGCAMAMEVHYPSYS